MPTINLNKGGAITGATAASHAAARDVASGQSIIQDSDSSAAIQYFFSSGRGGGTFRYTRSFLQFDTSGITGTVTAATLNIESDGGNDNADVIVCASDAFGGTSDDLVNDDFNNLDFSTPYSSELPIWADDGNNNAITLNSAARSAIPSDNSFICAAIDHDSDFQDTDSLGGSDGNTTVGINFGGTITLVLTVAASGPANLTSYNGIAKASITSINGIAIANITTLNGIS